MASSVSSERASSSAGITISKCRNRLKGIIVEALQCLKCLYHNDLIFREVIMALEETLDMEKDELHQQKWEKQGCVGEISQGRSAFTWITREYPTISGFV